MISLEIDKIVFNLGCAFYENCSLPKEDNLCNCFPKFTICPEYQAKKDKLGL